MKEFSGLINAHLSEQKISQAELARRTNLNTSTISDYCTGKYEPTLSKSVLLADALNISLDTLAGISTYSTKESNLISLFKQLNETNQSTIISNVYFLLSQQRMREVE